MTQPDVFATVLSKLEDGAEAVIVDNGDTRYCLTRTPHTRILADEGKIRGLQVGGPEQLLERLGGRTATVARAISGYGESQVVHRGHLDIGDHWRTGRITSIIGI